MSIDDLKKRFILDPDALRARLEPIVEMALRFCVTDKDGRVHIVRTKMAAKDQVMTVLIARSIASQMESQISADVTVGEISAFTGLPDNQVRARGRDLIDAKLAHSPTRGVYRAHQHKIEEFLNGLCNTERNERSEPSLNRTPRQGEDQ